MPNWTENGLVIKGKEEDLEAFKEKYLKEEKPDWSDEKILILDFNKIIPEPETFDDCPEEYRVHNAEEAAKRNLQYNTDNPRRWFDWYKWHCENWGTKWNCNPVGSKVEKGMISILFDTAWSPAIPVIEKLIQDNPQLEIGCEYYEPGMWFGGLITKNGVEEYDDDKLNELFGIEEQEV